MKDQSHTQDDKSQQADFEHSSPDYNSSDKIKSHSAMNGIFLYIFYIYDSILV